MIIFKIIFSMKRLAVCSILILLFSLDVKAKSATIHITVKNFRGIVYVDNPELQHDLAKMNVSNLHLDAHQSASYTMVIDRAELPYFIFLN